MPCAQARFAAGVDFPLRAHKLPDRCDVLVVYQVAVGRAEKALFFLAA